MIGSLRHAVILRNMPFKIEEERVLREMRIPAIKTVAELEEKNLAARIAEAINRAYALIRSQGAYMTYTVTEKSAERVAIEPSATLIYGASLCRVLAASDYVSLLATTIGPELEEEIERLKPTDLTMSYLLDQIGGWMADYGADRVEERIRAEMVKNGYKPTMRFSPGYGEWQLDAQPEMLKLAHAAEIGIELTDTMIMVPRKSVSAVLGWEKA